MREELEAGWLWLMREIVRVGQIKTVLRFTNQSSIISSDLRFSDRFLRLREPGVEGEVNIRIASAIRASCEACSPDVHSVSSKPLGLEDLFGGSL
eukprot:m.851766 g.851766  ORF g.851766 m.851766 type:complete len:95 (+) comp59593_c0_seq1:5103-5387(+)